MGRPSRKRPRPPAPSLVDSSRFKALKPRELIPSSVSRFEEYGSIQSLVMKGPPPRSNGNTRGEETTTTTCVQQVWGALDQADVAAISDAPGLSLGINIDIDEGGIAWLLNTPRQSSTDRALHTGPSEKHRSQHCVSSLGPQQHQAASAAITSAAGADNIRPTTLDPPCSEDNPHSASGCHSSGRQEQGEEDARYSFCVCNAAVRAELSRVKHEFHDIPPAIFKRVRSACNPAEALGSGLFLNRSAMKLANIDAVAGLSTSCSGPLPIGRVANHDGGGDVAGETRRVRDGNCRLNGRSRSSYYAADITAAAGNRNEKGRQQQRQQHGAGESPPQQQEEEGKEPKQQQQRQHQQEQEHKQEQRQTSPREREVLHHGPPPPFLFADLCGGPGGFSEYLLRRRRQLGLPARGWGISLRGGGAEPTLEGCRAVGNGCQDSRSAFRDKVATLHACNGKHDGAGREGGAANFRHGHCGSDSCAWRLDHLSPWCDVSTEGGEPAQATLFGEGDVGRCADSEHVGGASANRNPNEDVRSEPLESLAIGGKAPETHACPLACDASVCGGEHWGRGGQLCEHGAGGNRRCDPAAQVRNGGGGEPDMHHAHVVTSVADVSGVAGTNPSPRPRARPTSSSTATTTAATTAMATAANAANCTTAPAAASTATSITAPPLVEMRINYGPAGTGDLADEENMYGFVDAVLASTGGRRLDLVVADGGIEAARDSGEQECLMSSLVHSEVLTALLLLEEGGSFVCKLFEVWTEPTASLVYLLHRKFRRIAIVKPITSRPASGERYLVCVGLLPSPLATRCCFTDDLRAKVHAVQLRSGRGPVGSDFRSTKNFPMFKAGGGRGNSSKNRNAIGGVACDAVADGAGSLDVSSAMKADAGFLSFLRLSNDRLACLQAQACARIIDVASSKRGRAWAFRDSKGRIGDRRGGVPSGTGDWEGAGERGGMGDEEVLQCFRSAWLLDELEDISLR